MKLRLLLFQIMVFLVLCGCSDTRQTEHIQIIEHELIDLGGVYLGAGGFLTYRGGSVVGIDLHPAVKQPFFTLSQDETFYTFGNKGRGPDEFLMPFSIQLTEKQTIGVFDAQTNTYSEFDLPRKGESPKVKKEVKIESRSTRIIKTAFNQYISLLSLEDEMFSLIDSSGVQVNTFFEYPYQDKVERENKTRSIAYQGTLSANPLSNIGKM